MIPVVRVDGATGGLFARLGIAGAPFALRFASGARRGELLRQLGFGGWSPTVVHVLDVERGEVHFGSGLTRSVQGIETTPTGHRVRFGQQELHALPNGLVTRGIDLRTGLARFDIEHDDGAVRSVVLPGSGRTLFEPGSHGPTIVRAGARTELIFGPDGWLAGLRSPDGGVATVEHDNGALVSVATATDLVTQVGYDDGGRVVRVRHPNGLVVDVVRHESPGNNRTTLVRSTGTESATTMVLDDDGTLRRSRWCCGDGAPHVVETGPRGRREILPDGTTIERARRESAVWGRLGGGAVETVHSTPSGQQRRVANAVEETATVRIERRTVDGATWTRQFDRDARTVRTTTPEGRVGLVERDAYGRTVRLEQPGAPTLRFEYDDAGRIAASMSGTERTVVERDPEGRVRTVRSAAGREIRRDYTAGGATVTEHLPGGRQVVATMASWGDEVAPPGRPPTRFERSPNGWVVRFPVVDGSDGARQVVRDPEGRTARIDEPHGSRSFEYGGSRVPTRLVAGTTSIDATLDPASGRVVELRRGAERIRMQRDGGLLTGLTMTGVAPAQITHHFERQVRVATEVGDFSSSITRDRDGLVTGVGPVEFRRDPATGALLGRRMGVVEEAILRDPESGTTDVVVRAGDRELLRFHTTFDDTGRRSRMVETIDGETVERTVQYDVVGRVVAVRRGHEVELACRFDENANRTQIQRGTDEVAATHDAQDRLRSFGSSTLTHDETGRLVEERSTDGARTYEYDELGSLVGQVEPDGTELRFHVDPHHRRVGTEVAGQIVQRLVWSSSQLLAVLDESGAVRTGYGHGDRHHPEWVRLDGVPLFVVADHVGSIRALIDPRDGTIVRRCDFDVDGRVRQGSVEGDQPLGFVGGLHATHGPLVRLGVRDYHPEFARFTSRDPLLFGGGSLNLYAYPSDPVNRMDPTGMVNTPASTPADYSSRIPSEGVSVCATDFMGSFEHGMVSVDGRVWGQDGTAESTSWVDQTDKKIHDPSLRCEPVPDVDEQCIRDFIADANAKGTMGRYLLDDTGTANMCWDQVWDATQACGGGRPMPEETVGDYVAEGVYEVLHAQRRAVKAVSDAMGEVASWFD